MNNAVIVRADNNDVCGIVTDRDILLRSVACNKDSVTTPISEIMTTKVYTVTVVRGANLLDSNLSSNIYLKSIIT